MKTTTRLLPILILSMQAMTATAADTDPVDTSKWKCKFCPFEEAGFTGQLDIGVGYVSDDSYKFGEYNGLYKQGAYFIGDADLRVRGEDAKYWDIRATNLGLDSRSISIEGGKQGSYKLLFSYDELPHYISDSTVTPFLGVGSNNLTLPASWVRGTSTATMTDLSNSLHDQNLETKRKRLGLGATLIASGNWQYAVNFRRETREGTQAVGSSFFFNSAQLVMPVEYVTQQIDVSASYARDKLQAKFAYYGSLFSDDNTALTWQNPYSSANGADSGQLALPPDNEFHQIMASLGYDVSEKVRATGEIALGRMTQNANFLAPTVNTSLAGYPFALPRNSLDGEVDTTNVNLKLASTLTPDLRMNLAYIYNDHDDKTPQAAYTWITTDSLVNAVTRTNLPYSFTQTKLKFDADYRFTGSTKLTAGIDNDVNKRTYQEVSNTTENTYWAKVKTRAPKNVEVTLKLAHAVRDVGNYEVLPWLNPAENPLLIKYNMADRDRDQGALRIELLGLQDMTIGFGIDYAKDNYTNSVVGLTESKDITYSADATAILSEKTNLYVYLNHEKINSTQLGSSTATTPDWTGQNEDTVNTLGLGVKHTFIEKKLNVGADYNVTKSRGKVLVDTGAVGAGFPDNTVDLQTLKLYATYQMRDNLSLKGTFVYERFDSTNWSIDGVAPDTIPNVLSLGAVSPTYNVHVIMMSLRYKF
jgi:MtrB/PioB family decaheme-associated outer membrane protein